MGCGNPDSTTRFGNAKEFGDKGHYVGHVLGHMTTDNQVEFIIGKRVGEITQIVNHIGVGPRVGIDAY
jgi:hypothetical protein